MLKIFCCEMRRIAFRRRFIWILAALLCMNAAVTGWQIWQRRNTEETAVTQEAYTEYIDTLVNNAKLLSGISLFADENSYTRRNAAEIVRRYSQMQDVTVTVQSGKGAEIYIETEMSDFLVCVWTLLLCYWLVLEEKLYGQYTLNRSTRNGRCVLGRGKYLLLIVLVSLGALICMAERYALITAFYNMGDWNTSVQSIFPASVLHINIGQFFLLSAFCRLLSILVFSSICYAACQFFRDVRNYVWLFGALLLGSMLSYYIIRENSWLVLFRQINLWHFLNATDILCRFCTVNLFGYPIDYVWVYAVCQTVLLFCSVPVCLLRYGAVQTGEKGEKRIRFSFWKRHTNLMLHEGYKLWGMGRWWLVCLLLAAVCCFFLRQSERLYNTEEEYYEWQYCEILKGEWTEESRNYMLAEAERFDGLFDMLEEGGLAAVGAASQLSVYNAYLSVLERGEYLEGIPDGWLLYERGYRRLFPWTNSNEYQTKGVVLLLLLCLGMGTVWEMEERYDQRRLIGVTKKGIRQIGRCKAVWSFLLTILIYLCVFGPMYLRVFRIYGWYGLNAPAASLSFLGAYAVGTAGRISIGVCLLIQAGIQVLIAEAAAFALMGIFTLIFREERG